MNRQTWQRFTVAAIASSAIMLTTVRCGEAPSSTALRPTAALRSAAVSEEARARAAAARAKVAWMARVHSDFVQDLTKNKVAWLGTGRKSNEKKCAVLWQLLRKYAPRVAEHAPITPRIVDDVEAYAARHGCAGPSGLMAFVRNVPQDSPSQFSIFGAARRQSEPTGAYQAYTPGLEAAYDNSVHPANVETRSWAVVDQAAADGLSGPDLEALSGFASISVSSSYDWYAYEQSGGFDPDPPGDEMSLFQSGGFWSSLGKCDLLGAMLGGWSGGFGGAVVLGAAASGICALAFM